MSQTPSQVFNSDDSVSNLTSNPAQALPSAASSKWADQIPNFFRSKSLWAYSIAGVCCANEVFNTYGCRFDLERFGVKWVERPEEADLLFVSAPLNPKLLSEISRVYQRMSEPKYVIALGACACTGGLFHRSEAHEKTQSLNDTIPVDVFVPGCPPRPEAIMDAVIRLQEKIRGSVRAR